MNKSTRLYIICLSLFIFILGVDKIKAQVTIGSDEAPVSGALLQLKNKKGVTGSGENSDKGLSLPRVELPDLKKLKIGNSDELLGDEREKHIGLLVYNTNSIETQENRICPGLHVWGGEEWQTITPYAPINENVSAPTLIDEQREITDKELYDDPVNYPIGYLGQMTDIRNNGLEVNKYHYARFYAVKVKEKITKIYQGISEYSCNPSSPSVWEVVSEEESIEDGIWMTENMNTKYAPYDNAPILRLETETYGFEPTYFYLASYVHPNNNLNSPPEEGLLYNWAAATVTADGVTGKGGPDGRGNVDAPDKPNELFSYHKQVQGICPEGWHLPRSMDYYMLNLAVKANTDLYSIETGIPVENYAKAFKDPNASYMINQFGNHKGTSKPADQGGWYGRLVGHVDYFSGMNWAYDYESRTWTSSHCGDDVAWGQNAGSLLLGVGITSSFHATTDLVQALLSVRCKKN